MSDISQTPDLLDHLADGVLIVDRDGIVQYANRAAHEMFAGMKNPLIGFHFGTTACREGGAAQMELPGGDASRYVELRAGGVEWGEADAMLVSLRDVTERVMDRRRIEHLNQVFRSIHEVNRLILHQREPGRLIQETCGVLIETRGFEVAWIGLTDEDDSLREWGQAGLDEQVAENFFSRWRDGALPDCCREVLREGKSVRRGDACAEICPLAGVHRGRASYIAKLTYRSRSYGFLCVCGPTEFGTASEDAEWVDQVAGDLAMALRDIELSRERERTLATLSRQEELLNKTGRLARVGGWEVDLEENTVIWTDATKRIHEVPDDHQATLREALTFFPDCRDELEEAIRRAREEGVSYDLELPFTTAKGRKLWVRTMGLAETEDGRCVRLHGAIQDITGQKTMERKRIEAQEAARRERDRARNIIENGPVGITIFNRDGRFVEANEWAQDIFGLEKETILERYHNSPEWKIHIPGGEGFPEEELPFTRVMNTAKPVRNVEFAIEGPDGAEKLLRMNAAPLVNREGLVERVVCSIEDMTEQKLLEEQLNQSRRLESIGELAGGVAHDFNNQLMGIMGYAEMCLDKVDKGGSVHKGLEEIIKAVERSANLTRQLLAFARKQSIEPEVLDLNEVVGKMLKMLRRLIGEDIEIQWRPGAEKMRLKMDPSQIDQILVNLCVNARDAIQGAGHLTIGTRMEEVSKTLAGKNDDKEAGTYVELSVRDDGCGMEAETRAHIFEPFYTTKNMDKGTGLGLSTLYGIVKQNHGFVEVDSRKGEGTTFKVYLPFHEEESEDSKEVAHKAPPKGNETVLVVEDEKSIRETLGLCLEFLGYNVLTAGRPEKVLQRLRKDNEKIDLLITDVIMPGMNGVELAKELAEEYPGLKIIYISGYTSDAVSDQDVEKGDFHFLRKPIGRDRLAAKVREVLDG